jgi:hypothetical protein
MPLFVLRNAESDTILSNNDAVNLDGWVRTRHVSLPA